MIANKNCTQLLQSMAARQSSRRQLSFSGTSRAREDDRICELCHGHHHQLSSPAQWRSQQARDWVQLSLQVRAHSIICKPCKDDVTRMLANPAHTPRWKKERKTSSEKCCILNCSENAFVSSKLASIERLLAVFESIPLQCSGNVPIPTPFCKHHYHLVYNNLQPTQTQCVTCSIFLKYTSPRQCPQPTAIQEHLRANTGFEGQIQAHDKVCYTCYKSHLAILQEHKIASTDSDLKELVTNFSKQIPALHDLNTVKDVMHAAMLKATATVGEELLSNHAILLPSVHDLVSRYMKELLTAKNLGVGLDVSKLVPSRWILSNLTANLTNHMSYSCQAKKYGTILYRPNSSLLTPLSQALWKLRNIETKGREVDNSETTANSTSKTSVFDDLNQQIHSQVKELLERDAKLPFDYSELNIDQFIHETNPQLWEAICLLTRSVTERRGSAKVTDPSSPSQQIKKMRRFFLLCSLLFCTDDRCSMPLHTLMADIIESQGGTHLLIKILNRFGICASSDTLSRFIQYQVNALKHKNDNPLELEGFTIVSADNIDFLHSYARIFCGNQASSWHGTTIQAGQPLPSLSLCESFEFSTTLGEPTHRHLASAAPLGEPTHRHLASAAPLGEPTHRHLASAAPLGEPTHRHLASAAPLGEPTHRHLASAAPLGEPTHRHLASAAPLGEPTHRHLASAAPLGEPTHRHLASAAPLGEPTHRHLTSAAPLGEPTHRHLASAAPLGEPTHRHLASAAPLGEPTHRHLASAAPLGEPTHRHLASAAPLGEPTHRHLASAAPLGEPTHRHLASAAPLGEPTHRHLASAAPLGEPTHRHLASAAPLGEPTHRHLTSAAPLGEPTHRHLASAAPLGEPTHRHLASAAPLGEPTHRHLTSAAPLGEPTHRHLASAAPLGEPTHRHLASAAPLGEPTHRHLASAAPLGEPTHRHLTSAAPLGEPTHRHLASAAPLGEPTHRHLTSAAPLGEPTHRHLASAAPLGEPTHRHLASAAPLGEPTHRHLASAAHLGEPTHRHLASFELSIPISGPDLLQDFSAMEVGTNTNGTDTQSRKRTDRSSPIYSPLKTTRSPAPKIRRRIRTGTEKKQTETDSSVVSFQSNWQTCQYTCQQPSIKDKTIAEFKMREEETMSLQEMHRQVHTYMFQKHAVNNTECEGTFLNIQDYFSVTQVTHTEKSRVVYLEVMDAIADSKDTMMQMLHELSEQYIIGQNCKWLIVEGDAKVYDILQSIKFEYSDEVKWLIPYPGDWHMLKNYQLALMKPYFDAGLKSLAKAASYPLAAIQSCGQFKRTHRFLMEVWEATYRAMLTQFLESQEFASANQPGSHRLLELIIQSLQSLPRRTCTFHEAFNHHLGNVNSMLGNSFQQFKEFLQKQANSDDTWKFWSQFVFEDAMGYVGLFLAIRSGNWNLRMACMKLMAPVFTAFNHPTYQKLISQHLADVLCMPPPVLAMLEQGAFVISISGRAWHSVGIDEAHEMLINKACKTSIVRPSKDYINRIAHYIPYRTKSLENLKHQIFPETKCEEVTITSSFTSKSDDKKYELNVQAQISAIKVYSLFPVEGSNRGLVNPFTKKVASPSQSSDLLNFRSIGQKEFLQRINSFILKQPSVNAPNRKRHLQTFSERQTNKRRISQLERDKRLILSAMRKKMLFSKRTGQPIEKPGEQLLELPLAISDNDGKPLKGQKSYTTRILESRYKATSPPVFSMELPWQPQCSLLEGMFLINTAPLGSHRTLADYARFLMRRYVITEFNRGSSEVHIIFDTPGRLLNTPKYFEHVRRDQNAKVATNHYCDDLATTTKIPARQWRENFLNCRACKRNLVKFLGKFLLDNIGVYLQSQQTLYVAGAHDENLVDSAWFVTGRHSPQPDPSYTCNGEEADTRLWLHAKQTRYSKILVLSPDTDVYHIGLPLQCTSEKEIIVQVSAVNSKERKLINLRKLLAALQNDPDLADIDPSILAQIFQTLFVVSGCDYISFFSQLGKATFMRYFFQYASFITAANQPNTPGTLANITLDTDYKTGFLSFIRLIGVVYFKKHASGFDTPSPQAHFSKFRNPSLSVNQQHSVWLDDIRQNIWDRIKFENETIPSYDALYLHWQRSCWVMDMWRQADQNTIALKPITEYGWGLLETTLTIVWDTPANMEAVRNRVQLLLRGCKCVTGCKTGRCSCKKANRECTEGCQCTNCLNITMSAVSTNEPDDEVAETALEEELDELEIETDELIDWVFGEDDETREIEYGSDTDLEVEDI